MKKLHTLFFLTLAGTFVFAQSQDSTFQFSVKQAIDFAMQNQKDVLNAGLDAEIAAHKVKETIGIGLPQISANLDVKDYEKIPVSLVPAEFFGGEQGEFVPIQFGTKWNATAGVSASQLIFDPSYLVGVSASRTYKELSYKNLDRTKLETAIAVTKAYYAVLLSREAKKVLEANQTRLEKLSFDTKAMYENGFVEKIDADRVKVAYNNIKIENENYARTMEISERMLRFQMGLPQNANLILTDSIDQDLVKKIQIPDERSDATKRIEYSILKTSERLQEYNLKRYKRQYFPSLVAYGSLNTMAQRTEFNFFDSQYGWYPTGVIGATLSFNLFDGTQREQRIRQEKLALRKIGNEIVNFENSASLEASASRSKLKNALESLKVQDENLQLANSVSNTTKLKYQQGVGSNIEVLDSETSLLEAQVNYFTALYNAVVAKIDLDRALGNFTY